MSSLLISGGGVVTVATEDMMRVVAECRSLSRLLRDAAEDAELLGRPSAMVLTRQRVSEEQHGALLAMEAASSLRLAAMEVAALGAALTLAIDGYSRAEWRLSKWVETQFETGAYLVGRAAPFMIGAAAPLLLGVAAAAVVSSQLPGASARNESASSAANELLHDLLSQPATAELVRLLVSSADELLLGAMQLPPGVAMALDDDRSGSFGLEGAAALIALAAASVPTLADGAVEVGRTTSRSVAAPGSLQEMTERIPDGSEGQVTVERYTDESGAAQAIVYLGGTTDDPGQPWDMASNLRAMGGGDAGSIRAAEQAMREAGIQPDDRVVLVGYSQGGLVASRLAQSGEWNIAGMLTVGSPGAAVPVSDSIPVVALEHSADIIPALSGGSLAAAPAAVTVTRTLTAGELRVAQSAPMPAHQLSFYTETARQADRNSEPRLAAERSALLGVASGTGSASSFSAVRLSADDPRGGAAAGRSTS